MAWRPFTICGDSHGDMIDSKARKAFLDFCDAYRPDIRIHLGDAIDFRGWRKGASPEDKAESMQRDYDMGMQFLRDMGATVWLWGNHDKRVCRRMLGEQARPLLLSARQRTCNGWVCQQTTVEEARQCSPPAELLRQCKRDGCVHRWTPWGEARVRQE